MISSKRERPVLIELEIGGFVGVLQQFRGAEAARILVRILEVVIPLHRGAVLGVAADDLDRLAHHVQLLHAIDRDAVLRFDAEDAFHRAQA